MRIERFGVFTFPMPFKTVIRHASASRRRVSNLIVAAYGRDGQTGYGEGCPREYVTGETMLSGSRFIAQHAESLVAEVTDAQSLRAWIEAHQGAIDANPAAFCAIENRSARLDGQDAAAISGRTAGDRPNRTRSSNTRRSWPIGRLPCSGGSTAGIGSAAFKTSR